MTIDPIDFPYITTLLSAFVAFGVGVFWYNPKIMGARWLAARNKVSDGVKMTQANAFISLGLWLLASCFYSFLLILLEAESLSAFLSLSCLLWVAFAMPPVLMGSLYTGYPFKAVAIDATYQLSGYYIFALVHFLASLVAGLNLI